MTLKSSSSFLSASGCLGRKCGDGGTNIFASIWLFYLCCMTFAGILGAAEHSNNGLKEREFSRLLSYRNASVIGAASHTSKSTLKNRLRRQHQSYSMNEYGRLPPSVPPPLPPPPQQPDYSYPRPVAQPPVDLPSKSLVANASAFVAPSAPARRTHRQLPTPPSTITTTSKGSNSTSETINKTSNTSSNSSSKAGNNPFNNSSALFGVSQFTPPSYGISNNQFPSRVAYSPTSQAFAVPAPGPLQFPASPRPAQQSVLSQVSSLSTPPRAQFSPSAPPPPQSVVANFVLPAAPSPLTPPLRTPPAPANPSPNSWANSNNKLGGNRRNRLSGGDSSSNGQGTTSLAAVPSQQQQSTPSPSSRPGPSKLQPAPATESHRYYYPPRMPLPLPTCFHNPTGYACCNPVLNDLMVETYTELEARPRFHTCNINAIAAMLQSKAEQKFNTSFETIAGFEDFAQKIHFNGDLVCKVELGGKYMLAYGSVRDVSRSLPPEETDAGLSGQSPPRAKRQLLETTAPAFQPFIGPVLEPVELPPNHISRRHSMWI